MGSTVATTSQGDPMKTAVALLFLAASPLAWAGPAQGKSRILVIATGGTIAGIAQAPGGAEYDPGQLTVDAILKALPDVKAEVDVTGRQLTDPTVVTADNPHGYVNVASNDFREHYWL